jgi:hypothetical protein
MGAQAAGNGEFGAYRHPNRDRLNSQDFHRRARALRTD